VPLTHAGIVDESVNPRNRLESGVFDSLPAVLHAPDDLRYWVAFRLAEVASASRFQALLDVFGSLEAAWQAEATQLRRVLGGRERTLSNVIRTRDKLDPDLVMERLERAGVSVVTIAEEGYPRLLREITAPPPVLFYKGQVLEGTGSGNRCQCRSNRGHEAGERLRT